MVAKSLGRIGQLMSTDVVVDTANAGARLVGRDRLVKIGWVLLPFVFLGIWVLLSEFTSRTILPGPQTAVMELFRGVEEGWLIANTAISIRLTIEAFVIGGSIGLVVGIMLGSTAFLFDLTEDLLLALYAVPKISVLPLFIILFGVGSTTKLAYGTVGGFFPALIISMNAVRTIDDIYLKIGESLQLSNVQLFRHIILPSILTQLVVALRLSFSVAFLGVVVAGLFASKEGLGLLLQGAMGTFDSTRIYAIVIILVLISFVGNVTLYAIQKYLERQTGSEAEEAI